MKAILWDVKDNLLKHNCASKIIQKTKWHRRWHFHSMKSTNCLKLKRAHRKSWARCDSDVSTQKVMCTMWFRREEQWRLHVHMWTLKYYRVHVWPGFFPYTRFKALLHSCDFKFQSHVANVYLQCYSRFLSHTFWLCVCVCLNKILGADTQLRKARKQTCKDTQWNVRGLAGMFTIKNKLYHIMTGKVN